AMAAAKGGQAEGPAHLRPLTLGNLSPARPEGGIVLPGGTPGGKILPPPASPADGLDPADALHPAETVEPRSATALPKDDGHLPPSTKEEEPGTAAVPVPMEFTGATALP